MTDLKVRRIRFEMDDDIPFLWNPSHPIAARELTGGFTFQGVAFEKYVMRVYREAIPLIKDPEVAAEAKAFLRQEAHHASEHQRHADVLIRQFPGLGDTIPKMMEEYEAHLSAHSLEYHLAYIADLEATFTPGMKFLIDNRDHLLGGGDARIASLMLWHFVEEIEHRSSALIVYNEIVGKPWYRLMLVPAVARQVLKLRAICTREFEKHVPAEELHGSPDTPWSEGRLSKWAMFVAVGRMLMAQTPFHDPAKEPLPTFVEEWHARDRRGKSMTRVFGVGAAV